MDSTDNSKDRGKSSGVSFVLRNFGRQTELNNARPAFLFPFFTSLHFSLRIFFSSFLFFLLSTESKDSFLFVWEKDIRRSFNSFEAILFLIQRETETDVATIKWFLQLITRCLDLPLTCFLLSFILFPSLWKIGIDLYEIFTVWMEIYWNVESKKLLMKLLSSRYIDSTLSRFLLK